jgi:hypothetical protein
MHASSIKADAPPGHIVKCFAKPDVRRLNCSRNKMAERE